MTLSRQRRKEDKVATAAAADAGVDGKVTAAAVSLSARSPRSAVVHRRLAVGARAYSVYSVLTHPAAMSFASRHPSFCQWHTLTRAQRHHPIARRRHTR